MYYWDQKRCELFDLIADLGEYKDLSTSQREVAAQLEAELKAHLRAGLGEEAVARLERGEFPTGRGQGPGKGGPKKRKGAP